jgi:hypothetical protein
MTGRQEPTSPRDDRLPGPSRGGQGHTGSRTGAVCQVSLTLIVRLSLQTAATSRDRLPAGDSADGAMLVAAFG